MSKNNHVKVLIVGAGVAGLSAAKTLLAHNIPCLVIEAQNYIGGRVCTVEAAGADVLVELGAQYILNDPGDVVFQFYDQLGTIIHKTDKADFFLTSKRERLDDDLIQLVWQNRQEVLTEFNEKTGRSLLDCYTQRLSSFVNSDSLRATLVDWLIKVVDEGGWSSVTDDWRQTKSSLRPFINHLSSTIADDHIKINSQVTSVKYNQESHMLNVELMKLTETNLISSITCDHVIWTTSLGYLKQNFNHIFASEPELILQKEQAIKNLPYSTANKIILVYETPVLFWPKGAADIYLLRDREAPTKLNADQLAFIAEYNVDPDAAQILLDSLFYVAPSNEYCVLTCWVGGRAAVMAEDINEAVLGRLCHDVLCQFLAGADIKQQPIRTIRTGWHSNSFMCGSYSSFSPQAFTEDQEKLRLSYAPDGIPRVLFAGEACHPIYVSTIHGAYETGREAAETLVNLSKKMDS